MGYTEYRRQRLAGVAKASWCEPFSSLAPDICPRLDFFDLFPATDLHIEI